jgi:hypothetical protein
MDIDLTPTLKKKMAPYPRRRGRYNASELYGITHGYLKPEDWISPKERPVKDMMKMWMGILVHDHTQRLLPPDTNEVKKEHYHKGITLVAKADNVPEHLDEVWEFKSNEEALDKAKPWHEYQAKLYATIFGRSLGVVYQPVCTSKGLFLKRIGTVDRDDVWFEEQMSKLFEFHLRVEKLWEEKQDV